MRTAKRYLTYTLYGEEDHPVGIREDLWNGVIPDNAADWVWQWSESSFEARKNHNDRVDEREALLYAGLPERETY